MKSNILKSLYGIIAAFSLLFTSCADDFPIYGGDIPEGVGSLSATVTFTPTAAANLGETRTPGNAIQDINSLCVLVYSPEGKLLRKYGGPNFKYTVSSYTVDSDKDHLDGNEAHTEESTTAKATFTLNDLPYGMYKIYAVANMGDMTAYEQDIKTETDLKKISLDWKTDVPENNQMFGYFTPANNMESEGFDAPIIVFKERQTEIHAWLKRVVSKVTIAFDPSGLKQGVSVYIKNVTIRDIPKTCLLAAENTPNSFEELYNHLSTPYPAPDYTKPSSVELPHTRFEYNSEGLITTEGEHTGSSKTDGFLLTNRYRNYVPTDAHNADAPSLFFYENNQQPDYTGMSETQKERYNKKQKHSNEPDGVGIPIRDDENDKDFKDRVQFGTYIEVEAYYISTNPDKVGEGSIKYRFMLGKDVMYNYDAQRNYHFKLTLGFNGWANDPDWHIDYELPEPGIEVPPLFRVSYLYHQMSELPIRILGDCQWLTVTVTENNWAPYDPASENQWKVPPTSIPTDPDKYEFKWNYEAFTNTEYMTANVPKTQYGFLSLHLPNRNTTTIDNMEFGSEANEALEAFYDNTLEGERRFDSSDFSIGPHLNSYGDRTNTKGYVATEDDKYTVKYVLDDAGNPLPNQLTLMLPVWTRAKTLIFGSGFSGNNPYEAFERKAVLHIAAVFKDGTRKEKDVEVRQVKRLVNPKGVWRDAGRNETFNVTLLEAENSNAMSNFQPFESEGEWTAYIDGSTNSAGFSLDKSPDTNGYTTTTENGTEIHGYTGTKICFAIKFGTAVDEDKSECAIVKVLYHGNQCLHKILIRKGYAAPVEMGGNVWSSYSLYQANPTGGVDGYSDTYNAILTKNPLMLGSMFRRGIQSTGIRVKSNMEIGFLDPPKGAAFEVASSSYTTRTWTQIGFRNDIDTEAHRQRGLGTFFADGRTYKVPSFEDWQALTDVAEFGYGVVYGSAAEAPALSADDAYGLIDPDNTGEFTDPRGMRGVIAYDKKTGNQIFFPVGKYGTGRRTMFNIQDNTYEGVLRYSDEYRLLSLSLNPNNLYRPIPYNLPISSGNVYWTDVFRDNVRTANTIAGRGCLGWDLNYFNFDFNAYTANNYRDACPIKLIIVK